MGTDGATCGMLMTTTATRDAAALIARTLLEARLAACVQILPIESYYSWKGAVANDAEFLLLIKTRTALFADTIEAVRRIHPYETPEIVCTDFAAGSSDYFGWIESVTRPG